LSRLIVNPRSAAARRDLADPYEMHRTLTRAFVDAASAHPPRFLWRLEPQLSLSHPTVLVQSAAEPAWQDLMGRPGYLQRSPVEVKSIPLDDLLQQGHEYRCRLLANPTVTREGKRIGLVAHDAQMQWLHRQAERHGFVTLSAMVG